MLRVNAQTPSPKLTNLADESYYSIKCYSGSYFENLETYMERMSSLTLSC